MLRTTNNTDVSLTIVYEGAYFTLKSFFHKSLIYFSLIVKSRLNLFLEPTSTEQWGKTFILKETNGSL